MPKGYLIAHITVTDPLLYAAYAKAAGDLLKAYGARSLIRPDSAVVLEGQAKARSLIFEFDTFEQGQSFLRIESISRRESVSHRGS